MDDARPVLDTVRRALVGAAGDLSFDAVLQQLVDAALDLAGARYAALGVPDGEGGFSRFITSGMDAELIESLGPLPRTHGLLDAMLTSPTPYRTPDVREDPRFRGWWPPQHPEMRSFLGYPIVFKGDIVGAFYLTDKVGAEHFSERDERLVGEFAPHAAVLVEMARLYGQNRELSVADERNRIARELHDSLTQTLFGTRLALRTAIATLADQAATPRREDVDGALQQLDRAAGLLDNAFDELRALVWDLQPPDLEVDGLTGALRKQLALLERTSNLQVDLETSGATDLLSPEAEHHLLRIVQEAVTNAVRHAGAGHLTVSIRASSDGQEGSITSRSSGSSTTGEDQVDPGSDPGPHDHELVSTSNGDLRIEIRDDGSGFDASQPAIRNRRLGLTSMHERTAALGGRLSINSAPGQGTVVRVEVPLD